MRLGILIFVVIMAYSAGCGYLAANAFGLDPDLWAKVEAASHAP